MISLPERPTRPTLASFGIVTSIVLGSLVGAVTWSLTVPWWWGYGLAVAMGLGWLALQRPYAVMTPYRMWNALALRIANYARLGLTGICFVVVTIAGRAGAGVVWRRPRDVDSAWVPKQTLEPDAYPSQSELASPALDNNAWVRPLVYWSRVSSNLWVLTITPLLMLLSAVQREPHTARVSETNYTLY